MTNLLALTKAANEQRGTTKILDGIEVAHTVRGPLVSVGIGCTDSWQDLLRSLDWRAARFTPTSNYLCHRGYLYAANLVREHLEPILAGGILQVAGHSLGGAVARLVARLFASGGHEVRWVETYGEPASQGRELARSDAIPGCRYVCGSDPGPSLQPLWRHGQAAIRLDSPHPWGPFRGLLDHRLSSYEAALSRQPNWRITA